MSNALRCRSIWLVLLLLVVVFSQGYSAEDNRGYQTVEQLVSEAPGIHLDTDTEEPFLPPVMMDCRIQSYVGQETLIRPEFVPGSGTLSYYAYDFESDGTLDVVTNKGGPAAWRYSAAGQHIATVYAVDDRGHVGLGRVVVEVAPGLGAQEKLPMYEPLSYNGLKSKRSRQALEVQTDDSATYALIWAQNQPGGSYVTTGVSAYKVLDTLYGIPDSNIYFVVDNRTPYNMGDDSLLVDLFGYVPGLLDSAANFLYSRMGPDDRLIMINTGHGLGMVDSSFIEFGDYASLDMAPYSEPYNYEVLPAGDPDIDFSEAEVRINYHHSWRWMSRSFGMYEWAPVLQPDLYIYPTSNKECYRRRMVSQFSNLPFYENDTIVAKSDGDIWLELIYQPCLGDSNHNGIVEQSLGEVADADGNGIMPVDTLSDGSIVYDEDDWDSVFYKMSDDYRINWFFDHGLDSVADYKIYSDDTSVVRCTDSDNDGYFVGIDLNGDGDMLDSTGVHELGSIFYIDTVFSNFLDSLQYSTVQALFQGCYSGGFIENGSRENVIISTATTDGTVSWGGAYAYLYIWFMSGWTVWGDPDVDSNGCLSIAEVHNVTRGLSRGYREWYDDNGDGVPTGDAVPAGHDGILGSILSWSDEKCWQCPQDTCIAGDVNHSCTISQADLTYLLNYVYHGGPDPIPIESGDLVGTTCAINLADVTKLSAIVNMGDTPPDTCGCAE